MTDTTFDAKTSKLLLVKTSYASESIWDALISYLTISLFCFSFSVSYLTFLAILYTHNELDTSSYIRGPPDTGASCVCRLKDRQQEARAVLVGSHYIGDYYKILELKYMYYIPLTTLLSGLFIDIKHVKFT